VSSKTAGLHSADPAVFSSWKQICQPDIVSHFTNVVFFRQPRRFALLAQ